MALMNAVRGSRVKEAKALLKQGCDPDFLAYGSASLRSAPLHEAVRNHDLPMIRALVNAGADVNIEDDRDVTPLDIAFLMRHQDTIHYLKSKGGKSGGFPFVSSVGWDSDDDDSDYDPPPKKKPRLKTSAKSPVKREGPVFTKENLKDIFESAKWTGKVEEMQKLWEKVPERLKKTFDFAASLSQARRDTIKKQYPKINPLHNDGKAPD